MIQIENIKIKNFNKAKPQKNLKSLLKCSLFTKGVKP